ncbi:MAG: hypothetical protein QHH10_14280 [Peptococcaceae bacterium]|nr:hypothetical protein [Peptococcaceae bacterium]MDH7526461.1 hypothetical protein [Peptococcaceae bacterium]
MGGFPKAHLVFPSIEQAALEEFSKCCLITGRNSTLEETCNWAQEGGGEDPDLILINCAAWFSGSQLPERLLRKKLLQNLSTLKKNRPASRLVLLLPARAAAETQFISGLLQARVYNFWFLDSYDREDIINFIYTDRSLAEVERYLEKSEKELANIKSTGRKKRAGLAGDLKRIHQPYYVKSNIIAFWSEDDALLNHGTAVLTALNLAENGFKVALIETVSSIPRLASTLSLPHPYYNTRHALSMFAGRKTEFYKDCLFNAEKYQQDKHTAGISPDVGDFPPNLYFLPDGRREDNLKWAEMENNWRSFITELARVILFQKDFNFLLFCGHGKSMFNDVVLDELAYIKFITVNMLPCSIVYGLKEMKDGPGKINLIGTSKIGYIEDQLNDLKKPPLLYPPRSFAEEFTDYVYLKKKSRIGPETRHFIKQVTELIGIKSDLDERPGGRGSLMTLRNLLKISKR